VNFFDTSVLVPAVRQVDARHPQSSALMRSATPDRDATAAHALTEVFSTLTRLPKGEWVPPAPAQAIVADLSLRLTVVSLTAIETLGVIRDMSTTGLGGGMIYDAIILACARKIRATAIYTHNVKHFQRIAPDLANIIREP
jgi:predicted nucleic acid-binding protein